MNFRGKQFLKPSAVHYAAPLFDVWLGVRANPQSAECAWGAAACTVNVYAQRGVIGARMRYWLLLAAVAASAESAGRDLEGDRNTDSRFAYTEPADLNLAASEGAIQGEQERVKQRLKDVAQVSGSITLGSSAQPSSLASLANNTDSGGGA
jgi:hypothetical protein